MVTKGSEVIFGVHSISVIWLVEVLCYKQEGHGFDTQ
jgi:hypothetical protein